MREEPYNVEELATIFGYASRRGVNRAVLLNIFPVPTYKQNGHNFAHADHVAGWLDERKQEAELAWMDED